MTKAKTTAFSNIVNQLICRYCPQNTNKFRNSHSNLSSTPSPSLNRLRRKLILMPSVRGKGNYLRDEVVSIVYSTIDINLLCPDPTIINTRSLQQMAFGSVSGKVCWWGREGWPTGPCVSCVSFYKFISVLWYYQLDEQGILGIGANKKGRGKSKITKY